MIASLYMFVDVDWLMLVFVYRVFLLLCTYIIIYKCVIVLSIVITNISSLTADWFGKIRNSIFL